MARPSKQRRTAGGPSPHESGLVKGPVEPPKSLQSQMDDSEDEDDVPEKRLRFVDVLTEVPNGDAAAATELALAGRGLTEAESLESCKNLRKVELKDNKLSDLGFLEMNHQLCWLGAAKNRLHRMTSVGNLSSLAVLDLSDNRLVRLECLSGLSSLKALIVARNRITRVEGISPKRNPLLETLVLSHNKISECDMASFPMLKKLSLANNQLHAFPNLASLPQLTELRLNGNRISTLTKDLQQPRLSILDIGNNLLAKVAGLEPLRGLLWIKSVNLFRNPVAQDMEDRVLKGILSTLPKLEIVNDRRLQADTKHVEKKKGRRRSKGNSAWQEGEEGNGGASKAWGGWHENGAGNEAEAPAAVAIHGRGFEGKRQVFADDSESDAGGRGGKTSGKVKKKKKRELTPMGTEASADVPPQAKKRKRKLQSAKAEAVVDTYTQQETGKPRAKKKVKRRKNIA